MICGTTSVCIYFSRNTRVSDMCFLTLAHLIALLREKLTVWLISYFSEDTVKKQKEQKVRKSLVHLWIRLMTYCMFRRIGECATIFCLLIKKNLNNVALNFLFRTIFSSLFFFSPWRSLLHSGSWILCQCRFSNYGSPSVQLFSQ